MNASPRRMPCRWVVVPTALVIIYWIWTSVSLVVLAHRAVRRLRARRDRRRAWQTLGARTAAAALADAGNDHAGNDRAGNDRARADADPDVAPVDEEPVSSADPMAPEPVTTAAAAPRPAETVVPNGPPRPSRARARPRPADDLVPTGTPAVAPNVTPVASPIAARAVGTAVAEVLAGVRLPDDFVPVIDDVVTAAGGRCLRFDAARPLVAAREDLVAALAAAGVETTGEEPDELVARRGEGAVRITLVQAPPSQARPVPAVRVELASLS